MTSDKTYIGRFEQKPDGTCIAVYASACEGVYLRQENRRNCTRDCGAYLYIPYSKFDTFEQLFRDAMDECLGNMDE